MDIRLQHTTGIIQGEITLESSKSISNRALIIRALCEQPFRIENLSKAADSVVLQNLLDEKPDHYDCGAGGTTFRFLTAFLAIRPGQQVLTGTEGLQKRPVEELVRCLTLLGANIQYLNKEGFPPLRIGEPDFSRAQKTIEIDASISSQFVSALLMIAPMLPEGLSLKLNNSVTSRPYIDMTLQMMAYFGVESKEENGEIRIAPQKYVSRDFFVESDWSGASYFYAAAALSKKTDLQLNGLFENSWQGDRVISLMAEKFGVQTTYNSRGVQLFKDAAGRLPFFEYDFTNCPDLVQTMAVLVAGLGTTGLFSGLESLKIKETDRIFALKQELGKAGVLMSALPDRFSKDKNKIHYLLEGKISLDELKVDTYDDHRMALSFFPLALRVPVLIQSAEVVGKSYPNVWSDLEKLGFTIEYLN